MKSERSGAGVSHCRALAVDFDIRPKCSSILKAHSDKWSLVSSLRSGQAENGCWSFALERPDRIHPSQRGDTAECALQPSALRIERHSVQSLPSHIPSMWECSGMLGGTLARWPTCTPLTGQSPRVLPKSAFQSTRDHRKVIRTWPLAPSPWVCQLLLYDYESLAYFVQQCIEAGG